MQAYGCVASTQSPGFRSRSTASICPASFLPAWTVRFGDTGSRDAPYSVATNTSIRSGVPAKISAISRPSVVPPNNTQLLIMPVSSVPVTSAELVRQSSFSSSPYFSMYPRGVTIRPSITLVMELPTKTVISISASKFTSSASVRMPKASPSRPMLRT